MCADTERKEQGQYPAILSPSQTIATFQPNIGCNMLHAFGHHVVICRDMSWHDGCCWLKFVDVAWCSRLARFVQQCCTWACPLQVSTRNMGGQTHATWCAQQSYNLLRSNVVIVWSGLANSGPTMLGCVALRCCYHWPGLYGKAWSIKDLLYGTCFEQHWVSFFL